MDLRGEVTSPGSDGGGASGEGGEGGEGDEDSGVQRSWRPFQPGSPFIAPRPLPDLFLDIELGLPELSISDLESFVPVSGRQAGEPAGWGIVGLETNFYAESSVHVVDGELAGFPTSVRFTPVAWHWAYGDGTAASTSTPGAPWRGAADEFEPTVTSHRYDAPGTYTVSLAVEFAAEYRLSSSQWTPVNGTVTAPAEPLRLRVGTAETVLVERGCEAGSGPGC